MKYGVISDTHCHNWTTFSSTNKDGVNSRLAIILSEIKRAAEEVKAVGGKYLFHAGDIFHVRGTIAPSVMNPTLLAFQHIVNMGIKPVLVCGNHDAEFKDANDLGSAIEALSGVGCFVVNTPTEIDLGNGEGVVLMPWIRDKLKFLEELKNFASSSSIKYDLICHAPIDGALKRFTAAECFHPDDIKEAGGSKLQRVFAGHIHNHKKIEGYEMWSVGAIAHHNWGDIGTKAGFVLVDGDKVEFRASRAPEFVEITSDMSETDAMLISDGNYVRATVEDMDEAEIKDFRVQLEHAGAKGVTIICHKKPEDIAQRMEIKSSESLESIVAKFVDKKVTAMEPERAKNIAKESSRLLKEAENEI